MTLQDTAEQVLLLMRKQGFEQAQLDVSHVRQDEVNINHNEPSLLRSTESRRLAITGLVDGRKASAALTDLSAEAIRARVQSLYADAAAAPQDAANAVSSGQRARIEQ